jgi:hypothetical protein
VTKSVVIPIDRMILFNSRRVRPRSDGSRFESGSSRSRIRGSGASARASATRCCCPPEICVTGRRSNPERSTEESAFAIASRTSFFRTPCDSRPNATFSPTVMCGKSA